MIDSFAYFNEQDIFFLRLEYLSPYVDKFIIVELDTTFSLLPHEKMFDRVYKKLPIDIKNKIIYEFIEVDKTAIKYDGVAGSADYKNKSRLIDNIMRNKKLELIKTVSHNDYMMMSDIDEFWDPRKLNDAKKLIDMHGRMCWKQDFRSGFIDWRSVSEWWPGTKGSTVDQCPIDVCRDFYISKPKCWGYYAESMLEGGWHFTMMGGEETKSNQISAKREAPGWFDKLKLTPDQISKGMMLGNYNNVLKKSKMKVNKISEDSNLDPQLYSISKKYKSLWSRGINPQ